MDNIKQKSTIVSHETIEPYYICWNNHGHDELRRIYSDDDTEAIYLEVITPACNNYSPFEATCISECTWCDNPYHCKYKNVSHETHATIDDLMIIIDDIERMCNDHQYESCTWCRDETACDMTIISISMLLRGEY